MIIDQPCHLGDIYKAEAWKPKSVEQVSGPSSWQGLTDIISTASQLSLQQGCHTQSYTIQERYQYLAVLIQLCFLSSRCFT